MPGNVRPCLFCGSVGSKLTREHAYPRWLHRALNVHGSLTIRSAGSLVRVAKDFDIQVRGVCGECNAGWMNDLEATVRDVLIWPIRGFGPFDIDVSLQREVARWAVKTWLLVERALLYARGGEAPIVDPSFYHWLRTPGEPPPLTQVWIGAVDAKPASLPDGEHPMSILATQWVGHAPDRLNGIVGILTIGYVLFMIYSPVKTAEDSVPMGLGIAGTLSDSLTQIWPDPTTVVQWPPQRVFTLDEVHARWPDGGMIKPGPPPAAAA